LRTGVHNKARTNARTHALLARTHIHARIRMHIHVYFRIYNRKNCERELTFYKKSILLAGELWRCDTALYCQSNWSLCSFTNSRALLASSSGTKTFDFSGYGVLHPSGEWEWFQCTQYKHFISFSVQRGHFSQILFFL